MKDVQVGIRIESETLAALRRAAQADDRTVSWLIGHIVKEWLAAEAGRPVKRRKQQREQG